MTAGPSVGARAKGLETRARILDEALRAFAEQGAEGVVLRRIAAALGMQLGNLQYYFPNRQELLLELMRTEGARGIEQLRCDLDFGMGAEEALRRGARRFVEIWSGSSGAVMGALSALAQHDEEMRAVRRGIYEDFYAAIIPVLETIDPGHAPAEYELRARLVTALLDGAPMQVGVGPRRRYLEAISDAAVALACGLRRPKNA